MCVCMYVCICVYVYMCLKKKEAGNQNPSEELRGGKKMYGGEDDSDDFMGEKLKTLSLGKLGGGEIVPLGELLKHEKAKIIDNHSTPVVPPVVGNSIPSSIQAEEYPEYQIIPKNQPDNSGFETGGNKTIKFERTIYLNRLIGRLLIFAFVAIAIFLILDIYFPGLPDFSMPLLFFIFFNLALFQGW
jgi:hypothetical protein